MEINLSVFKTEVLTLEGTNKNSQLPIWNGIKSKTNTTHFKIKNELSNILDKSIFWWFVGRYLADGWLINYPRKDRKNSLFLIIFIQKYPFISPF